MSKATNYPHLIAYDIANPKRLRRIHRFLKKQAIPVQYSVFMTYLNASDRQDLLDQLEAKINPREDDIRIYPLPKKPEWSAYGKALWQEGIYLTAMALPKAKKPLE